MGIPDWQKAITKEDIFYAYRKAKADTFFDRSVFLRAEFAKFELVLDRNLQQLLDDIHARDMVDLIFEFCGEPTVIPKSVKLEMEEPTNLYFSNPKKIFSNQLSKSGTKGTKEFRIVGNFPPEMHILSALWVNLAGHEIDGRLTESARAVRLRRLEAADEANGRPGEYHKEATGSFPYYAYAYRKWQQDGLDEIRHRLKRGNDLIVASLDLKSYYHSLNPDFLQHDSFWGCLEIPEKNIERVKGFTSAFSQAFEMWSDRVRETFYSGSEVQNFTAGLPIDLSFTRIVANAFLHTFDKAVKENLAPVYYGRYVDDLFIVLKDPGNISDTIGFWNLLMERLPIRSSTETDNEVKADKLRYFLAQVEGFMQSSNIEFNQEKKKLFFLDHITGIDFVSTIEHELKNIASERRIMIAPNDIEDSHSHHILTNQESPDLDAGRLGNAINLSIKRTAWSIQLHRLERFADDLNPSDWLSQRREFYKLTREHLLSPGNIFDFPDAFYRVFSLAVAMGDWKEASDLHSQHKAARELLVSHCDIFTYWLNGIRIEHDSQKQIIESSYEFLVMKRTKEAFYTSLNHRNHNTDNTFISIEQNSLRRALKIKLSWRNIIEMTRCIFHADLGRAPFKQHILEMPSDAAITSFRVQNEFASHRKRSHSRIVDFCKKVSKAYKQNNKAAKKVAKQPVSALVAPTRPLTPQEIAFLLPNDCVFVDNATKNLAYYSQALRGVWVGGHLSNDKLAGHSEKQARVQIGKDGSANIVRIGVSGLQVQPNTLTGGASGRPDLSMNRYRQLGRIVTKAVQASPSPDYLVMPELSIPHRWIPSISRRLLEHGISLIAGTDYVRDSKTPGIHSEVVMVLTDNRLGYPTAIQIHQPKAHPAPGEDRDLLHHYGRDWASPRHSHGSLENGLDRPQKPIYIHNGFAFGALVCSELQNIEHRFNFRGKIDALFVVASNRDLPTFSPLVESASLDIHAYTILVNNLAYGDSRIRSPAKEAYKRDICRLRGGSNEHLIVEEINVSQLRNFQSRAKPWPKDKDPFKPVPDGFMIERFRRKF